MRADQIERIREFLASESFERLLGQVHDDIQELLEEHEMYRLCLGSWGFDTELDEDN